MARVLGIGGVFFKAQDPAALSAWYAEWLGLEVERDFGCAVFASDQLPRGTHTVWSPFPRDTDSFEPSTNPYMINLMVDDVDALLERVREGGGVVHGEPRDLQQGRFGWFSDPEGNKVELCQPAP